MTSLIDRILYLPIASTFMTIVKVEKMTLALKESIVRAGMIDKQSGSRHTLSTKRIVNILPFGVLFIFDGFIARIVPYSREIQLVLLVLARLLFRY